jgi:diguanylate cyclase (GGDEF)-like protein
MEHVIFITAKGLVVLGICLLFAALGPVQPIVSLLVRRKMRSLWYVLAGLILFFIAGYTYYALTWSSYVNIADLSVPLIFFLGACFVFIVTNLSLKTARDIRRVAILEEENITDPLMGIFNRRYLERRLEEEVARSKRYNLPLSILLIDIDYFKNVNDTYGHQVGDDVLENMGKMMDDIARDSDIVARYGGEEILIVLPSTPISGAVTIAERLRLLVESHAFRLPDSYNNLSMLHVTVSIGVAFLGQDIVEAHDLVERADKALYAAKKNGRNRVVAGS